MSNEFILIVAWKPVSRQYGWRSTSKLISKVKIDTVSLLESEFLKKIGGVYDVKLLKSKNQKKRILIKTTGERQATVIEFYKNAVCGVENKYKSSISPFAFWQHKNLMVVIQKDKIKVMNIADECKEIWSEDIVFSNKSFGFGNWSCSSRYLSAVESRLCVLVSDANSNSRNALFIDIGIKVPVSHIIAHNVSFIAIDKQRTNSVYWIDESSTCIGHNNLKLRSASDFLDDSLSQSLKLNCLEVSGQWIVAGGSIQNANYKASEFFLFTKTSGSYMDRLSIPNTNSKLEPNKLAAISIGNILVVGSISMFYSMTIFVILGCKLHLISAVCHTNKDKDSTQNYGIVESSWKKQVEFYVGGCSSNFLNKITLTLP